MSRMVVKARQRARLAGPTLDPLAMGLVRGVGPLYARLALRAKSLEIVGAERFVRTVRDFYDGRSRLILAFRHPFGDEPQTLTWAMHRSLSREARRLGSPLRAHPHCLFLHGYEVPLWSGPLVRWLLPRVGAMPVYHVRMDGAGLRTIRRALREGSHPLALAPEGQSSYRSETLPRLELGAFQLGFWCAEELEKAGRSESVHILPISVHERHGDRDLAALERAAARLERSLGLPAAAPPATDLSADGRSDDSRSRRRAFGLRLRAIDLSLLCQAESYYGIPCAPDHPREERRARLLEEALRRGETILGLPTEGDPIDRVYRIRYEGWSRVYPETDPRLLPPKRRAVLDRRASEAWHAMRHMELVDLGWYLDEAYLEDGLRDEGAPSVGRLSETLHNLYDLASRLAGGNISDRPRLIPRRIVLAAGEPIEMRSRLDSYRSDRRGAIEGAARDLATAWEGAAKEFANEKRH